MSEVITDKLTGRATANDVTITVGASATMSLEQGIAKCWIDLVGTGTISIENSLNISSITDNGTGDYRQTHTNNFANNDTAFVPASNAYHVRAYDNQVNYSDIRTYGSTAVAGDYSRVHSTTHGDLA